MFLRQVTVFLIFVSGIALNCKGGDKLPSEKNDTQMDFEIILEDQMCNYEEETLLKITTPEELLDVYNRINSTRTPGLPVPEIDFDRYHAAFYTTGTLSTGGHALKAIELIKHQDGILMVVGGSSPNPGEFVITVLTSPGVLIKFEKTDLPIKLKRLKL